MVHAQLLSADTLDCYLQAKHLQENAQDIAEASASVSCAGKGDTASPEDQAHFLEQIRDHALNVQLPELSTPPAPNQIAEAEAQFLSVRTLMAIRQADYFVNGSVEDIASGKKKVEVDFPDKIFAGTGFNSLPPPLSSAEKEFARKALATETSDLSAKMQAYAQTESKALIDMGMNPEVPVSAKLGDMMDQREADVHKNSVIGYNQLIAQKPYLLFVDKGSPSNKDILQAHAKYVQKMNDEMNWAKDLKVSYPPQDAALGFLFYSKSVNAVLAKNPSMCTAFNALMKYGQQKEQFQNALQLGLGLGAAGACIAAAVFTLGIAGALCLAAAASETALSVGMAVDASQRERVLYGGVLQGGDIEEYESRSAAAKGYLLLAGLSVVGLGSSALEVFGSLAVGSKVGMGVGQTVEHAADGTVDATKFANAAGDAANVQGVTEIVPAVGDIAQMSSIASKFPDAPVALQTKLSEAFIKAKKLPLDAQVESWDRIPWRREINQQSGDTGWIADLGMKMGRQPKEIQNAALAVYNKMHDPAAFESYMTKLTQDTIANIRARAIPAELEALEKGEIGRNAVLRVLVQRSKERGDQIATLVSDRPGAVSEPWKKYDSKQGFNEAVAQSQFFDKPQGFARHGVDMHFLQKDYIADVVRDATNGNPQMFWNYIGSKDGIGFWVPLFDAAEKGPVTLGSPETLRHVVQPFFPLD